MDDSKVLADLNERFVDAFRKRSWELLQPILSPGRDTVVVSARSSTRPGQFNRYVDTYARCDGRWLCVHACVWPLDLQER